MKAAHEHQKARPFQNGNTAAGRTKTVPAHFPISEETVQRLTTSVSKVAPRGVQRETIETAVRNVATNKGASLRDKQIASIKSLGGKLKDDECKEVTEGQYVILSSKQQALAWMSLSTQAAHEAVITTGNAIYLNLDTDDMVSCVHALATRQFTSKPFFVHRFVPRVPGAPTIAVLKKGFGELDCCKFDASLNASSSEVDDRVIYPWLRRALENMIVLDVPSLDVGFANMLQWFVDHLVTLEVNGVPLCLVTREIAKSMAAAQRERVQSLAFPTNRLEEELLTYHEPDVRVAAKMKLLQWSREEQAVAEVQWIRGYEMAVKAGVITPGATRTPDKQGAGNKQQKSQRNGQTGGGKRARGEDAAQTPAKTPKGKGKGGKGTPRAPRSDDRLPSVAHDPFGMDKNAWRELYTAGSDTNLCWFFSNAQRGCTRKGCSYTHSYPDAYNSHPFAELSDALQSTVLAKSVSA
jgi:hypothetical protein